MKRADQEGTDLNGIALDTASFEAFILTHYKEERLKSLGVLQ